MLGKKRIFFHKSVSKIIGFCNHNQITKHKSKLQYCHNNNEHKSITIISNSITTVRVTAMKT